MGITDVVFDTFAIGIPDSFGNNLQVNVVATIPGTDDTGTIYITGGHYDSFTDVSYVLAPGADDNGTGMAAVMEMARILATNRSRKTVRCIAFACEEGGTLGSYHYASRADSTGMNIGFMLCNDVLGNFYNDGQIVILRYPGIEVYGDLLGQAALIYTSVVPQFIPGYYSSDDWPFWEYGYPADRAKESPNSIYWHTVNDSAQHVSVPYCAELIKAGLAMTVVLSNYPDVVTDITVRDLGDGSRLQVSWSPAAAANITGYRLYWGQISGAYSDSADVFAATDTITGLLADSLYYISVVAIDNQGRFSVFLSETAFTPRTAPLAPAGISAPPQAGGISVVWKRNTELDLAGYALYRKIDGGTSDSLTALADTSYLDQPLSGANRYYYKVRAIDLDGNTSPFSAETYGRPVTLDQGILVVDETNNWTTSQFPRDAQQDSFYKYLLDGYQHQPYDFGGSAQKPVLADFVPYSAVVWHSDDPTQFLAYNDSGALREYLGHGGKLWFTGWKPAANIRNSAAYPADFAAGDLLYDGFKISRAELSGTADSFKTAIGLRGYPDISVDTAKYPATIWGKVMRNIEAYVPAGSADTIYVMDMKNNGSAFEGRACAVRDSGRMVLFGFPLYYMNRNQARLAAQKVMDEFGEPYGVSGKPESRISKYELRLEQSRPNPFKQSTTIKYQIPKPGMVNLSVYNIAGQRIRTLVNGAMPAGNHQIKWDGRDDSKRSLSAGIYFVRLSAGCGAQARKLIIVR